ncbi:MAG: DNA ligase [Butyricicoccus sp.]
MSKMAEMAQTIEELRTAAASITSQPTGSTSSFPAMTTKCSTDSTKKEPKPELKLEDVELSLPRSPAPVIPQKYALLKSTVPQSSRRSIRQTTKPDEGREVIGNGS